MSMFDWRTSSGSPRHEIAETCRVLSWLKVKELGHSGAEVAHYLGSMTSCINRAVSLGKEPSFHEKEAKPRGHVAQIERG